MKTVDCRCRCIPAELIQEIQGLEFYGGHVGDRYVTYDENKTPPEGELIPFLEEIYTRFHSVPQGIALLKGADLPRLAFRPGLAWKMYKKMPARKSRHLIKNYLKSSAFRPVLILMSLTLTSIGMHCMLVLDA